MINTARILSYLPTIGILIFVGLYFYATKFYPGGSQANINSIGFEWQNNHWCNLLAEKSMNGLENPARPIAIAGMVILCASMILFFFQFANYFEKNKNWRITVKISGTIAMFSAIFIFTTLHDVLTTVLSLCGIVVIIGMIKALYNNNLTVFTVIGVLSIAIIGINNFFYYNEYLIEYSPLIQKAGFILILSWTIGLNLKMNSEKVLHQSI
jgi:hypothetical protein